LFATKSTGLHLSYFIGNYKGGRNESFMYGTDEQTTWFDYDLVSAYTTAMSDLSLPYYQLGRLMSEKDFNDWIEVSDKPKEKPAKLEVLMEGYYIINGTFEFPEDVKYPSIPCYIDETTTVYPLRGSGLLTGPEYVLAINQGCEIKIISVFYIPPMLEIKDDDSGVDSEVAIATDSDSEPEPEIQATRIKPFHDIMSNIQKSRREYPKGTLKNLLYKEMGNSVYGNVVRGMSNKKSFDCLTGNYVKMTATELSNPILASWTTAFIRSVIGECLHNISVLGGKVVSVTTDGFITDLDNLEDKILDLPLDQRPLFNKYRGLRLELADEPLSLEVKKSGPGVLSWSTRGQLGIGSYIKATTGFQSGGYQHDDLVREFKNILSTPSKQFEFVSKRLRGAKDVFSNGGHVQTVYKDQKFRMYYDNRRKIVDSVGYKGYDLSDKMLDSVPHRDTGDALRARLVSRFPFTLPFNKQDSTPSVKNIYNNYLEIGVRNFVKAFVAKEPMFGLTGTEFKTSSELINFISEFDSTGEIEIRGLLKIKVSRQSIWNLRHRRLILRPVPKTIENIAFTRYLKKRLPNFRDIDFLKS
jgi:hypothetical protein